MQKDIFTISNSSNKLLGQTSLGMTISFVNEKLLEKSPLVCSHTHVGPE